MKAGALFKQKICCVVLVHLGLACSKSESDDPGAPVAPVQTITGSIKSITGSQSEMNQWVLALIEKDSGIAQVGVVNAVGNFSIPGVDTRIAHTFVLLDPQFKFSAVLSYPGVDAAKIRQYFKSDRTLLPTLVHNGPVVNFTDVNGLSWDIDQAVDSDSDGIPDGMEVAVSLALAATDTDGDGHDNAIDSDLDGDGICNWFDADDDGDSILDAFDSDANGDADADLKQTKGDIYFDRLIQYLAVQVTQEVQEDQSFSTYLTFTAKVYDTNAPTAVKVRGPKVLTDNAMAVKYDVDRGEMSESSWDLSLSDDGLNEDGAAGDKTFARKVKLAPTIVPKAKQVFFIQYQAGAGDSELLSEFAYTFPSMVTGVISGTYAAATGLVTLAGTPFGSITDFHWTVHVYDSSSYKVFSSAPIEGSISTYKIPTGILEAGESYTARIVATAFERIPSFPSWVIRSAGFAL